MSLICVHSTAASMKIAIEVLGYWSQGHLFIWSFNNTCGSNKNLTKQYIVLGYFKVSPICIHNAAQTVIYHANDNILHDII